MQLPEKLLESLQGVEGFNREAFEQVHSRQVQVTSIRINPAKNFEFQSRGFETNFEISKVPWCQFGYYLKERPSFTFDPLFHAGCYYVQEASSMFLEQALKQSLDLSKPLKILDISAAPGGKSTHIQSLISKDTLLVSNEVIRSRVHVLQDNIKKWGSDNVVVTSNDPKSFARLPHFFDAVVVDAPCSGSGLFRRDEEAINEWSENNVKLCSQRQQRIIADIWPALKKGGIIIYSTCSYSREEDEDILDWMMNKLQVESLELRVDPDWNIDKVKSKYGAIGYRCWPYKVKGEGFFTAVLKKMEGEENDAEGKVKTKVQMVTNDERKILLRWAGHNEREFVKWGPNIFAIPQKLLKDVNILINNLHVIYFGTLVGELVRDKLIPDHSLALSSVVAADVKKIELSYEDAIAYLKRKDLKDAAPEAKGWQLVTYRNYPLGWVNVLSNRINNYYPKELRILKDI